ncbi:MAG: cation-translocating P-type ATPase [Phycisphaerales bacterium]|nr:cation-translocating P-type ATPase [Phycisphaerales bacterium]
MEVEAADAPFRGTRMNRAVGDRTATAPPNGVSWHAFPTAEVLVRAGTRNTREGLTRSEAASRLAIHGPNELAAAAGRSIAALLAAQFTSLIVWLLLAAAVVSAFLGEWIDAAVIGAIVVLNAIIGAYQEYSAEQAIAALRKMTAPLAKVARDGGVCVIPASEVVPGDVLALEAGDLVAADARVVEAALLSCVEKSLTGESEPSEKIADAVLPEQTPLADRLNMVYTGTAVATGTARAVVIATGMRTEMGQIAALVASAASGEQTPLQARLARVGRILVLVSLGIVAVLFAVGLARGEPVLGLFLTAVSLAVAAVPEGLPAVVTVALALGVLRMARRRALIRRLPAVETLGSTSVICTDKTGTLTVGQMTVRVIVIPVEDDLQTLDVAGEGYDPIGGVSIQGRDPGEGERTSLLRMARNLVGVTNASISNKDGQFEAVGDPTEAAMLVAGIKAGLTREDFVARCPRIAEIPFDSDRKRSAGVFQHGGLAEALVNGSPEALLSLCTHIATAPAGERPMTDADREAILSSNSLVASRALRVLACAARRLSDSETREAIARPTPESVERDLTFIGLVGMFDPPRAEAREAMSRCRSAGVRVVMITGDHPKTAMAIARDLSIAGDGDTTVSGAELEAMDDASLARRVESVAVYARVAAADKLRIVRAWQARGAVVAMTGDGVNDAPALKGADVGVAMGRGGTEVAKQASDMVVTDDNFASIVAAVEEGRGVYDNIRKTMQYLLGGNAAELLFMAACLASGLPMPLLPVQILWINLVTDGLPALFLAAEPVEGEVMRRRPRPRTATIMDRAFLTTMGLTALLTGGVAMGVYVYSLRVSDEITARTHAFAVLVFAELLRSFSCRSETIPIWRMNWRTNILLALVVAVSFALQIWSHHSPTLASIMKTTVLSWKECLAGVAVACFPVAVLELVKPFRARHSLVRVATVKER